ncbi:MAG: hypothetical protein ACRD6X_05430 [Pyrinomonadaceae bacterium]
MLLSKLFSTIVITLLIVANCAITFAMNPETVSVQVGKSKIESSTKIKVEFVEMMEDSRCPADVNCIWAGNAKIKIVVSKNGNEKTIELNSGIANKDNCFAGYNFKLEKLTPEPRSDIRIDKNGYVATISMTKI